MYRCAFFVLLLALLSGCQRPFTEPERPRVEVLDPDLSFILNEREVRLSVGVSGARTIERVELGADTLSFDPASNAWRTIHVFSNGLNRLIFRITDADRVTTMDTAFALVDPLTVARTTPHLPAPRGGHTATVLSDGSVVVVGGAPDVTGAALADGLRLDGNGVAFRSLVGSLDEARIGHAAVRLPDDRILIVGGSRRGEIRGIEDLVEAVELFDPADERFRTIAVTGPPIRRAFHTATLHQEGSSTFIDLYGGLGDVSYGPPQLGTRADVRRFLFQGDSLVALDPAPGPNLDESAWGHSQVELLPDDPGWSRFLVSGARFEGTFERAVSFEITYDLEVGLLQRPVMPLHIPRHRHAAVRLDDGYVSLFGGLRGSTGETLNVPEIYVAELDRYFRYPPSGALLSRYGHTATKAQIGRIHLFGGFRSSGEGVVTTEVYQIPRFEGRAFSKRHEDRSPSER